MPVVERAQRNLCRKLGLEDAEIAPVEQVLKEFIGMFAGPVPENIIAAMTAIFDLDDEGEDLLNEALLQHAGEAFGDMELGDEAGAV
jgi:hypothetical protein